MSRCRSCQAEIEWVSNGSKRMPLDVDPDPERGNVVVHGPGHVTVYPSPAHARANGVRPEQLRVSHFVTCPNADEHRRPRRPS